MTGEVLADPVAELPEALEKLRCTFARCSDAEVGQDRAAVLTDRVLDFADRIMIQI